MDFNPHTYSNSQIQVRNSSAVFVSAETACPCTHPACKNYLSYYFSSRYCTQLSGILSLGAIRASSWPSGPGLQQPIFAVDLGSAIPASYLISRGCLEVYFRMFT